MFEKIINYTHTLILLGIIEINCTKQHYDLYVSNQCYAQTDDEEGELKMPSEDEQNKWLTDIERIEDKFFSWIKGCSVCAIIKIDDCILYKFRKHAKSGKFDIIFEKDSKNNIRGKHRDPKDIKKLSPEHIERSNKQEAENDSE